MIYFFLFFSLTQIRLCLTISAFIGLVINLLATNYNKLIANHWSVSQESIYAIIHSIVIDHKKNKIFLMVNGCFSNANTVA